jgi:hypothetical protein
MSESGSDQEVVTETAQRKSSSRANDGTELSTYGAVSLFSTVLTNALEQQKINIIQHFESRFAKNEKQTGVEAGDFVFKHEGNRIQHSFNSERADKLAKLESLIKIKDLTAASKLLTEEREILRKRNRILKIADKHGWDTVQEYLDSPLADDKDDAANLRTAMTGQQTEPIYQTSSHHAVEQSSMLGIFFVALASSTETAVGDNNNSLLENVSTVINKDTTLDSSPLKVPQQQRHSELPRNRHQRHSDDSIISTKTTVNEVEYNFDIDINYEVKSGNNLVNVKGSLQNHFQFWKNVLNASDYILNVIAFVSEPTSVMLRNNLSSYKHSTLLKGRYLNF